MSLSAIPRSLRTAVFQRAQGQCQYCQLRQVGQAAVFHVDHVQPRSKGGGTTVENLALQCPHCSLHKSSKTHGVEIGDDAPIRLFHPLQNTWRDHFELKPDGRIEGITPVGRVTVQALQMNAPIVRTARAMQIFLKLI